MAISHADHNHPNTTAARTACRKAMAKIMTDIGRNLDLAGEPVLAEGARKEAAKIIVVPRRRGDGGVVRGLKTNTQERPITSTADLPADLPKAHVLTIARAWERGWGVVEGYRLNAEERRILIGGDLAQVSLVWNAEGRSGVFVRSVTSSITHRVDSGPQALALASGDEEWPWMNAGKRV